jgi:hypothetical protein
LRKGHEKKALLIPIAAALLVAGLIAAVATVCVPRRLSQLRGSDLGAAFRSGLLEGSGAALLPVTTFAYKVKPVIKVPA